MVFVAGVPVQVQRRCQLGLVEHDDIRLLLADEPVKVTLLLSRVDAAHFQRSTFRETLLMLRFPLADCAVVAPLCCTRVGALFSKCCAVGRRSHACVSFLPFMDTCACACCAVSP